MDVKATIQDPAPLSPLHALPVMTEEEKQLLLAWNDTTTAYPKDKTLSELFEEQVLLVPDNTAVVFAEQQLTYCELNTKANQVAHTLIERGVQADTLVGIYAERSFEMIIGLLGILKAGGAYVPREHSQKVGIYFFGC